MSEEEKQSLKELLKCHQLAEVLKVIEEQSSILSEEYEKEDKTKLAGYHKLDAYNADFMLRLFSGVKI